MSRLRLADVPGISGDLVLDTARAGQFRHEVALSIPTGGLAEAAEVVDGAELDVRFLSRTTDALEGGAVEPATLSKPGSDLVLSLPVARLIYRVKLKTPISGDRVSAFRFDGDAVSDDPVTTKTHGSNGATLNITGVELILKRKNGSEFSLGTGDLSEVQLTYQPVNPRLSLRLAGSDVEIPFPAKLDGDGVPIFPTDDSFGVEFATALQSILDGLATPLPDPLDVTLILTADQPCRARIDALDVTLELEKAALSEKVVLRFAGRTRQVQTVALDLPGGANIVGGNLTLTVSGSVPSAQVQTSQASLAGLVGPSETGVRLSAEYPVATQLVLGEPLAIAAAEMLLAATHGKAVLVASLYGASGGLPGELIAQSAEVTTSGAVPRPVSFPFDPIALASGPVWFAVRLVSGQAVGLLGAGGPIARGDANGFTIIAGAENAGLVAVLHPVAQAASSSSTTSGTGPLSSLAGSDLPGVAGSGSTSFDLATLSGTLASDPTLSISSAAKSLVTVDPPRVRYRLG